MTKSHLLVVGIYLWLAYMGATQAVWLVPVDPDLTPDYQHAPLWAPPTTPGTTLHYGETFSSLAIFTLLAATLLYYLPRRNKESPPLLHPDTVLKDAGRLLLVALFSVAGAAIFITALRLIGWATKAAADWIR